MSRWPGRMLLITSSKMIDQQENPVRVNRAPARFNIKQRKSRKYSLMFNRSPRPGCSLTRSLKFQISWRKTDANKDASFAVTWLSRGGSTVKSPFDAREHTRLHSLSPSYLSQKCHKRRLLELLDGRRRNYKTSGSNWNPMKSLRMKTTITITRDPFHSLRLCQRILSPTLTSRPVLADFLLHLVGLALS